MNRVKNRFDKVLKLMMVFMMAVTCFSDFPIRVSAETLSVDSVVNIVSDKDAASESSEQAVLTVQVKLEDQTITDTKTIPAGTVSVSAAEGYQIDSMTLDDIQIEESVML